MQTSFPSLCLICASTLLVAACAGEAGRQVAGDAALESDATQSSPANAPSGDAAAAHMDAASAQPDSERRDASAEQPSAPGNPIYDGSEGGAPAQADAGHTSMRADSAAAPDEPAGLGPDCQAEPLADVEPFGRGFYQHFRGIFGCVPTADRALYRELLPAVFELPADPQVCFYINDFILSGVGRYREAAIMLPVSHAGAEGEYVLAMALDNWAATSGGRSLGFPKYMADVTLAEEGLSWVGTVRNQARVDLQLSYESTCWRDDAFPWPDFINLTPIPRGTPTDEAFLSPREGSVLMIPAEHLVDPSYLSLRGRMRIDIGDHLPWNGLVDEDTEVDALLVHFKGGVDLGNRPL